jgi:hemoglobin/transferrin/lactoferrin receptor protein
MVYLHSFADDIKTSSPIYITAEKVEITDGMVFNDQIFEDEITANPNRNVAEITTILPNVSRSGSLRGSNSEFKIRGMEDTRISTKIDGSKTNFRGEYKGRNFITPFMLSSINVSRGSNSIIDGSGSIAGSVNLKTKEVEDIALKSDSKKGTELFSSYSTNGNLANNGISTFVRDKEYSLLLAYNLIANDNFKMASSKDIEKGVNTKTIDYTKNKVQNGMFKFKKQINENEFFKLTNTFFTETGENTSNPFRLTSKYRGDPVDKNLINYRLGAELELEKLNIKAFYDETDISESRLTDGRLDETNFSSYGINVLGKQKYQTNMLENIIFYGLEWTQDDQNGSRQNIKEDDNRANLYPKGSSSTTGAYLQSATKFGNLKFLLGLRKDFYHLEVNSGLKQSHSSSLLKKAVLSYTFGGVFTPFVRYSEGYRAPLIKEAFASGDILKIPNFNLNLIANPDLKPEYSQNYETGFKFETENFLEQESKTSLNFTYFIQDVKDYIIQDPITNVANPSQGFIFQYQNLDKVRFNGLEVEAKYSSNKYLFSIAASTLKAEEVKNNNNILQTPSTKLVIKLARKFENGLSLGIESISAGPVKSNKFRKYTLNIYGQSNQYNSGQFKLSEETAGYSIVNFDLHVKKNAGIWGVSLQNAFNVYYQDQTSYIPGLGRNLNIYFKYKL